MNLTPGRYNRRKGSSHIAHDNMLGACLMMQRFEDDMEHHLNDQMNNISTCTEVERMQRKERQGLIWLSDHTMSIELHKTSNGHHHLNPCIFLPQNHMASFEFTKHSCKYKGVQGTECKIAPLAFWKKLKWQKKYHHTDPWRILPQSHIWYCHI